jgi:hypothetical protein
MLIIKRMFWAQALPHHPQLSWGILLTMFLVLLGSTAMFTLLVRRWTSRRTWVSLAQWCRESAFKLRPATRELLPRPLDAHVSSDEQVRLHLRDARTTLLQFQTDATTPGTPPPRWNVLIRRRPNPGAVAGLRPTNAPASLIDLLELSQFPAMTNNERFIVQAADYSTARRLADTSARALLPPDVGLILLEHHLLLDFSARPFDPIEFGRMLALADQLGGFVS